MPFYLNSNSVELLCQVLFLNSTFHLVIDCFLLQKQGRDSFLKNTCFFFLLLLMQSTSKLSLKKKTIADERGYLRKSLKKYILSHCTSFQIDVTPGGCENSFKASCPTGEQNWHLIAWSPVVSVVFSASGDYSVMMWKIKITIFKVYISQSKYL